VYHSSTFVCCPEISDGDNWTVARNVDHGVCVTKLQAIDWCKLLSGLTIKVANLPNCCKMTLTVIATKQRTFETAGSGLVSIFHKGSKYWN
jgi:adenylosuccinate lyase